MRREDKVRQSEESARLVPIEKVLDIGKLHFDSKKTQSIVARNSISSNFHLKIFPKIIFSVFHIFLIIGELLINKLSATRFGCFYSMKIVSQFSAKPGYGGTIGGGLTRKEEIGKLTQ